MSVSRRLFMAAGAAQLAPAQTKIRIAMLGTGHAHASGKLKTLLESPDFELVGVCEPKTRPAYKNVRWLSEDELFGDRSIQAVAVEGAVPENLAYGRKVIAAGKHLHIDKPPTNRMAPFRELIEEARRKKLAAQCGYIWRFHEGFDRAIEAANKGWLGDVFMIRGVINTDLADQARLPLSEYKGGMMFELGCHMIDRLVAIWGRPTEVRSWLRHHSVIRDKLADNTLAVFEYGGALAEISSATRMPGASQHRSFEITGTDGAMILSPVEPGNKLRVSMREARGPYKAGWQDVVLPSQPRYVNDFKDLARFIRTGEPLKYSYDHELVVEETLLRACGEI
jgi:predicted dehydrogenase